MQFRLGLGGSGEADCDGDDETDGPRENRDPEILRHGRGKLMNGRDPAAFTFGQRQAVSRGGGGGSREESGECAVAGGSLPKHSEKKCSEERGIHEGKDELQDVHDVVVALREIGGGDGERDTPYGRGAADPQVVAVRRVAADMALIEIVGKTVLNAVTLPAMPLINEAIS